jgi:hypothetical protein
MASVIVLGTSHQLIRMLSLANSVRDPDYEDLTEQLICRYQIDFIFEQASGLGPTTAQELAQPISIRYLDIHPRREERHKFGIAQDTDSPQFILLGI